MNTSARLVTLIGLSTVVSAACSQEQEPATPRTPSCIELASDPTWGLAGDPLLSALAAGIDPAEEIAQTPKAQMPGPPPPPTAAYCQVDLTDVSLAGPADGYLVGQTSKIRVRVGLPLNVNDGG